MLVPGSTQSVQENQALDLGRKLPPIGYFHRVSAPQGGRWQVFPTS